MPHFTSIRSLLVFGAIECVHAWTSAPVPEALKVTPCSSCGRTSLTSLPVVRRLQRRDFLVASLATAVVACSPEASIASYIDPVTDPPKITKKVYLDLEFGSEKGRLVVALYGEAMPRTVENFETLCVSNSYAGTSFYRVISDQCIQGGAISDQSGKTGKSSFEDGKPFEPDNFNIKHTQTGLVSMVRGIGGSVDSRFFINTKDNAGWADDRYAAFGIVEEGMDLVRAIEKLPVSPPKNSPKTAVKIVSSGVLDSI